MVFFLQFIMSSYREYEMNRKSMPKAIELLSKVDEIVQREDSKMLALRPIIADKMDALFVVYYYSSIASMGEIVDRVGMSEEFQKLVSEANEYGTLTSSNVLMNIYFYIYKLFAYHFCHSLFY